LICSGERALGERLLRRHVADGAEHGAGAGSRDRLGGAGAGRRRLHRLGEPEVENLDLSIGQQEHVLGFEIAMDQILVVRGRESAGDLRRDVHRLAHRQRPGREPLAQRFAVEQFHDDEGLSVMGAELEHRDDVGMRERRDRLGFALESCEPLRISGDGRGQDLDGHVAPELRVPRPVDLPHSAGANRGNDFIRTKASTRAQGHARGLWPGFIGPSGHRPSGHLVPGRWQAGA
jgi:hypothetical protein